MDRKLELCAGRCEDTSPGLPVAGWCWFCWWMVPWGCAALWASTECRCTGVRLRDGWIVSSYVGGGCRGSRSWIVLEQVPDTWRHLHSESSSSQIIMIAWYFSPSQFTDKYLYRSPRSSVISPVSTETCNRLVRPSTCWTTTTCWLWGGSKGVEQMWEVVCDITRDWFLDLSVSA